MAEPDDPRGSVDDLRRLLRAADADDMASAARRIDELHERIRVLEELLLAEQPRAGAVSEVLLEAFDQRVEISPERAADTIRPTVETAVFNSVRENSAAMAEALYPVMGPAIRKMVANLFTFDPSRSGRTFRVDQLLLIHRETGLLLNGIEAEGRDAEEGDIVSGMLDAIRAFVDDAFEADEMDGLQDLRVGDVSVLVEWGPHAILAAVTKGVPTPAFRSDMQLTLEAIHEAHEAALGDFDGAVDAFDACGDRLRELQVNTAERAKAEAKKGGVRWAPLIAALVLIALIVWLVVALT